MRFTVFIIFGIGNVWYYMMKRHFLMTSSILSCTRENRHHTEFSLPILIDFLIAWVDLCHGKCVRISNRGAINLIMLNHGVLNYENEL